MMGMICFLLFVLVCVEGLKFYSYSQIWARNQQIQDGTIGDMRRYTNELKGFIEVLQKNEMAHLNHISMLKEELNKKILKAKK